MTPDRSPEPPAAVEWPHTTSHDVDRLLEGTYGSAMELNATHRRLLSAVEAATSDRWAATDREIAAYLTEPPSSVREFLTQLAKEPERPLVEFATEVAQYYRPPEPPPMGEHRWRLTDAGREALEQVR